MAHEIVARSNPCTARSPSTTTTVRETTMVTRPAPAQAQQADHPGAENGRPSLRPGSAIHVTRRRAREATRSHQAPSRLAKAGSEDPRQQPQREGDEHAQADRHPVHPSGGPPLNHDGDQAQGEEEVLRQLRPGARHQDLGAAVADREPPRAQHGVVDAGRHGAALGNGVRQGRTGRVGDRGLAYPQAGQGEDDRRPVRHEVEQAECDRGEEHRHGDEGDRGAVLPLWRLVKRYQIARTTTP